MIGVTNALIVLAMYVTIVFLIGLVWRGREVAQKSKRERLLAIAKRREEIRHRHSRPKIVDHEEYAQLQG